MNTYGDKYCILTTIKRKCRGCVPKLLNIPQEFRIFSITNF